MLGSSVGNIDAGMCGTLAQDIVMDLLTSFFDVELNDDMRLSSLKQIVMATNVALLPPVKQLASYVVDSTPVATQLVSCITHHIVM